VTSERTCELATGETVTVPLSARATMVGAFFSASADAAREICPEGLVPVRVAPARTLVMVLGVDYHRIDEGQLDPYEEFGIVVLVTEGAQPVSLPRALGRGLGGYVWQLPVTTEPARALGDCWQYPKTVADVTVTGDRNERRATLAVDGQHLVTLTARVPPSVDAALSTRSYTDGDGTVRREPVRVDGRLGATPRGARVDIDGGHPWTDQLHVLGVGGRALATVAFDGEVTIDRPQRLTGRRNRNG
jgi:hypothetical protein